VEFIADIRTARDGGATDEQLAAARDEQRQAQFLVDFIEAENSMGFHAPQEVMRVLALSIDHTRKGQQALRTALAGAGPRN
jgi:nitrite reductase (cytochrome c-552)